MPQTLKKTTYFLQVISSIVLYSQVNLYNGFSFAGSNTNA